MKEKIKEYSSFIVLFIIIMLLFSRVSYDNLNGINNKISLNIDHEKIILKNDVLFDNELYYLSYEDINSIFANNFKLDEANKTMIVTTQDKVNIYEKDSKTYYNNFETKENKSNVLMVRDGMYYFSINEICEVLSYTNFVNTDLKEIIILTNSIIPANLKNNRIYLYGENYNKIKRQLFEAKKEFYVVKDNLYYDDNVDYCAITDNRSFWGYVTKSNILFDNERLEPDTVSMNQFTEFSYSGKEVKDSKNVLYQGLKLIDNNGNINRDNKINLKTDTTNKYIILTNGYSASNFDSSITSHLLQNSTARFNLIKNCIDNIDNFQGLAIDFRNFSVNNKEYFTQFVKELTSYAHSMSKKTIVYIPLDASYIDSKNISDYADYTIFIQYGSKSMSSKISGPDSSITWIEGNILKFVQQGYQLNKIIFEIPTTSILWTEKNQKVVGAERVNYSYISEKLKTEKQETISDKKSGQNYLEYIKGQLTYKVWIEDDYSINNKVELFKNNNCAGFILY